MLRWQIVLANFYLQVIFGGIAALSWQDGSNDNLAIAVTSEMRKPQQLVHHNFLVGIASLGASYENNTQCGHELKILLSAITNREHWGLKVVDYFGAPPSSFTWGNFFWFNTPELCDDLNQPFAISLGRAQQAAPLLFNASSPVAMQFVVVYLNFTTPFFIDLNLPFEVFVDYFGAPPSSFTWGNFFWFNTPELCDDLNQPFAISLGRAQQAAPLLFNASSPVAMQFVVVYLNFTTPFFIDLNLPFETLIHLGLCLPKSCCDSNRLRRFTNKYFQNDNFEMQMNFQLQMEVVEVKTPHFSWHYFQQTGCLIFLTVLCLSIFLPVVAEIVHKSRQKFQQQHALYAKNHHEVLSPQRSAVPALHSLKSSMWEKLLLCFRLVDNYAVVMSLDNSNNRNSTIFLTMMAGMRSIICLWITVFHVYYYSLFAMSNTPIIFAKLEKLALQPIMQACFYVDVFFVMSSFLLVYNFQSNTKQIQRIESGTMWDCIKMFLRTLLQRYMRLTPVMVVTMLLSTMVLDFLNMHSPFRLGEHSGFYCKANWWYNLLYIHNLLDMNCICCSWTWYLACEMQYFILLTGLLFVHVRHPKFAKIAFVTLTLGFVVIAWISNYANGITFQIDVIYGTLNQLYVKPWVRIVPYLGGAVMGWCMHIFQPCRQQQQQQHDQGLQQNVHPLAKPLPSLVSKIFWLLSVILYVLTNFMSYWRSTPIWAVATIMSLGKLVFSLWIGGIIVICARGYGGHLNALLSTRMFLFLNKLCFSVYMLAPVIVVTMFGLRNEPTNFTEIGSGADFMAVCSLAIASAILLYILVELPIQKMSKVLLG